MKCGIVDVGSNTIRLSIYQYEGQEFRLLLNKKEMAGLAGYVREGLLTEEGVQKACQVLSGFQVLMENLGIPDLRVFGTASLRNIANTEEAVEAIRAATGLEPEVLSGKEEARLGFLGAASGGGAPASGLLVDIGGGSTELVPYEAGAVLSGHSMPLGSLSLFTKYVSGLFPTREELETIRAAVEAELDRTPFVPAPGGQITGIGGTIRAAAKLLGANGRPISAGEVGELYRELRRGDRAALQRILRAVPDRVHTVVPGLAILQGVCRRREVERITVSASGVREGYLLSRVMGTAPCG